MSPLPAPEPSELLDTVATLAVRKLRMEIQHRVYPPVWKAITAAFATQGRRWLCRCWPMDGWWCCASTALPCSAASRFPAGTLEPNEQPQPAMERELQEEAGYSASQWDSLGVLLPCPGYSDEVIHLSWPVSSHPFQPQWLVMTMKTLRCC